MGMCKLCDPKEALGILKKGEPLLVPTDTVLGLGISVAHSSSPDVLFRIKRRDHSKPIAWLIADKRDLLVYGKDVPPRAWELAQRYWPGALTLVVKAADGVNPAFCSSEGTIALRVPACEGARALIRQMGSPLATSSANVSGKASAVCLEDVDPEIAKLAPYAVAGPGFDEVVPSGVASTIVDCSGVDVRVLRQGSIRVSCS